MEIEEVQTKLTGDPDIPNPKKSIKRPFEFFCQNTTAHGFSKISNARNLKRPLWITIVVAAYLAFFGHLVLICSDYFEYQTSTAIRTTANTFLFPDITFCPKSPFSVSKYDEKVKPYVNKFRKVWKAIQKINSSFEKIPIDSLVLSSLHHYQTSLKAHRMPQDQIIECIYKQVKCDVRNFTIMMHPNFVECFTFHPSDQELATAGDAGGLQIILSTYGSNKWFSEENINNFYDGYSVQIHERNTRPSLQGLHFHAHTETKIEVAIDMEKEQALSIPKYPCNDTLGDVQLVWKSHGNVSDVLENYTYTADTCQEIYSHEMIASKCKCLEETLIASNSLVEKYGFRKQLPEYLLDDSDSFQKEFAIRKFLNESNVEDSFLCHNKEMEYYKIKPPPPPKSCEVCKKITYKFSANINTWPYDKDKSEDVFYRKILEIKEHAAALGIKLDKSTIDYQKFAWRKGNDTDRYPYVSMNFFTNSLNTLERTEDLVVPLSTLFSNIGGIMGLWLGISTITLIEFIEPIGSLIRTMCWCGR